MKNRLWFDIFNSNNAKRVLLGSLLTLGSMNAAFAAPNNTVSTAPVQMDLAKLIPDAPGINAEAYILIDYNSGQILAEKNSNVRRDPASLTKMMTSYVIGHAIKSGKIHPNDTVVISKNARSTNPIFKGSSLMFLQEGAKVSVADLNRGIIIQSGNDACVAMAEHVAGSEQTFISLMNNYASNLQLRDTHYQTVHGLDSEGQYSTAHDMAMLGIALIRDVPEEYAVYKEKEFTFSNIRQTNRNRLLWDKSMNVDGIKTGHTSGAGYNLVSSATQDNMRLVAVVMGSETEKTREEQSKQLLTWGFRFFETVSPLQANKEFASQRVWFGAKERVELGVARDVFITIPRGRMNDLKASYQLNTTELHAPIKRGQVIGQVNFEMDGKVVQQQALVAMNDVDEGGFFSQILDYLMLLLNRWFGWFA
jgi:D-alanyl-D-alanine carboxypeptidase (penicillin-binding protein 5/6)